MDFKFFFFIEDCVIVLYYEMFMVIELEFKDFEK